MSHTRSATAAADHNLAPKQFCDLNCEFYRANPTDYIQRRVRALMISAGESPAIVDGDKLPTFVDLAARHNVAFNTAQRGVAALESAGLVDVTRGCRGIVTDPGATEWKAAEVVSLRAHKRVVK